MSTAKRRRRQRNPQVRRDPLCCMRSGMASRRNMDRNATIIDVADAIRLRAWHRDDLASLLITPTTSRFRAAPVIDFPFPTPATMAKRSCRACGGLQPAGACHRDRRRGLRHIGAAFGGEHSWVPNSAIGWAGGTGAGHDDAHRGRIRPQAMAALGVSRMQAGVLDFNLGSARVLEVGFIGKGVLRGAVRKRSPSRLRVFGFDAASAS